MGTDSNFSNQVSSRRESQYLLYNEKNLLLSCRKFLAFVVTVVIWHIFKTRSILKETTLEIETINFTVESSAFQNRHLMVLIPSQTPSLIIYILVTSRSCFNLMFFQGLKNLLYQELKLDNESLILDTNSRYKKSTQLLTKFLEILNSWCRKHH